MDVTLDFTFPSKCIYTEFDSAYLYKYYSAYRSTDLVADHGSDYQSLNDYLQAFKSYIGIQDLEKSLYGSTGVYTLPAYTGSTPPFSVHQIEMDGSGTCFGKDSWKQFSISTPLSFNVYQLKDPSQSNWEITKFLSNGPFTVDIGRGGYAGAGWIADYVLGAVLVILIVALCWPVAAAATEETGIGGLTMNTLNTMRLTWLPGDLGNKRRQDASDHNTIQAGDITITQTDVFNNSFTVAVPYQSTLLGNGIPEYFTSKPLFGFYDLYQRIPIGNRQACLLSKPGPMDQNCFVAGTSIIIQPDGTTVVYPLPDVSQAY